MQLAPILDQYHDAFQTKYGSRLLPVIFTPSMQSADAGHRKPASCGTV